MRSILFPIKEYYYSKSFLKLNHIKITNNNIYCDDDVKVCFEKQKFANKEHYEITIGEKLIKIIYDDINGKRYALDTLKGLVKNNTLAIGKIIDEPSFINRGLIEGYYGKPYSKEDRIKFINDCSFLRMNCYYYAPKDDLYHRDEWRKLYPENVLNDINEVVKQARKKHVKFVYCLSCGKDFRYLEESDYQALFTKLEQIINIGVNDFCMCYDDINNDFNLSEEKEKLVNLGKAHGMLSNKVYDFLKKRKINFTLSICPTDYMQNSSTPYREFLADELYKEIEIMWTGYNVVAEAISSNESKNAKNIFKHSLILWDNYPVNDYSLKYMYLGPIVNRAYNLNEQHSTYLVNPMESYDASRYALISQALYSYDSINYDSEAAFKQAKKLANKKLNYLLDLFKNGPLRRYNIDINKHLEKCLDAKKYLQEHPEITLFDQYKEALDLEIEMMQVTNKEEAIKLLERIKDLPKQFYISYAANRAIEKYDIAFDFGIRMNYFEYQINNTGKEK